MSKRQNSLQCPPDPSIIGFAEELGRVLARREFVKMEEAATRCKSAEKSDDGESCNLRPLFIRPAEPSLD